MPRYPAPQRYTAIAERDRAAYDAHGVGIEGRRAIAAPAQSATEAEDIRVELEKVGNVLGAQRAGEPGKHFGAVRCRDEFLQRRRRQDVGKRAAFLVGRVEHQPSAAGSSRLLDEIEIDAAICQQHADKQHVAEVKLGETLQRLGAPA